MRTRHVIAAPALVIAVAAAVQAQSLEELTAAVQDGRLQFHFASRPGMCGDGEHAISMGRAQFFSNLDAVDRAWRDRCLPGPVRVMLGVRDGRVYSLRRFVGPLPERAPAGVRDAGEVHSRDATHYLLALASRLPGDAGEAAIEAASFAGGVTLWPRLFPIARDRTVPEDTREAAYFWIAQAAAAKVVGGDITGDDYSDAESMAEHAIFVLSEMDDGRGIPDLLRIARSSANPRLRARAIFWLGQSADPRALEVFEQILLRQ